VLPIEQLFRLFAIYAVYYRNNRKCRSTDTAIRRSEIVGITARERDHKGYRKETALLPITYEDPPDQTYYGQTSGSRCNVRIIIIGGVLRIIRVHAEWRMHPGIFPMEFTDTLMYVRVSTHRCELEQSTVVQSENNRGLLLFFLLFPRSPLERSFHSDVSDGIKSDWSKKVVNPRI